MTPMAQLPTRLASRWFFGPSRSCLGRIRRRRLGGVLGSLLEPGFKPRQPLQQLRHQPPDRDGRSSPIFNTNSWQRYGVLHLGVLPITNLPLRQSRAPPLSGYGHKGNFAAGVKEKTPHMIEEALSYGDLVRADIGIRRCRVNEYALWCVIIAIRVVEFDGRKA